MQTEPTTKPAAETSENTDTRELFLNTELTGQPDEKILDIDSNETGENTEE